MGSNFIFKISYPDSEGKLCELYKSKDTDSVFISPLKQVLNFIKKNSGIKGIEVFYKNLDSQYNFGWKNAKGQFGLPS